MPKFGRPASSKRPQPLSLAALWLLDQAEPVRLVGSTAQQAVQLVALQRCAEKWPPVGVWIALAG
ncbi:MAG: hypothetical protein KF812_08700, partial [Fimbriimonadaceae bacterium]|nr:hypothetical protein [Fimbriimonadaceae bacterium]